MINNIKIQFNYFLIIATLLLICCLFYIYHLHQEIHELLLNQKNLLLTINKLHEDVARLEHLIQLNSSVQNVPVTVEEFQVLREVLTEVAFLVALSLLYYFFYYSYSTSLAAAVIPTPSYAILKDKLTGFVFYLQEVNINAGFEVGILYVKVPGSESYFSLATFIAAIDPKATAQSQVVADLASKINISF
jgi:hypothetical protein